MIEYHKIQSVFKRDQTQKHKPFLLGDWTEPEFKYLSGNRWIWTEKIDGTNVRVGWDGAQVEFGGRTDNAQMPVALLLRLQELFPPNTFRGVFGSEAGNAMLFGEGYGAKIQKPGSLYKADGCDFILFDVWINGVYLERENVRDVAEQLGIEAVPVVGVGTLFEAVNYAEVDHVSRIGTAPSEGIVLRPEVELKTRRGSRIITKLKRKDFNDAVLVAQ
jgi:ATP-dependent RNA circularization protein (DNA/RNA ligase family)